MDADQKHQVGHFMADPGQNPDEAKENSINLILSNLNQASEGQDGNGHMTGFALDRLGDAMHTLEDMTSPMHTTDDGQPKEFEWGFLGYKGALHWMGENDPSRSWARFGDAIRLTLAAYVQADPIDAARHGLNGDNFMQEADRRISDYVQSYYNRYAATSPVDEEEARQCALGNPAACNH